MTPNHLFVEKSYFSLVPAKKSTRERMQSIAFKWQVKLIYEIYSRLSMSDNAFVC